MNYFFIFGLGSIIAVMIFVFWPSSAMVDDFTRTQSSPPSPDHHQSVSGEQTLSQNLDVSLDQEKNDSGSEVPFTAIYDNPEVKNVVVWAALLAKFPDLAKGDDAIIRLLGIAEELSETDDQRKHLITVMLRHIKNPIKAIPAINQLGGHAQNETEALIDMCIEQSSDEYEDEVIQYMESITKDDFRQRVGMTLLERTPISDVEGFLKLAAELSRSEVDKRYYRRQLGHKILRAGPDQDDSDGSVLSQYLGRLESADQLHFRGQLARRAILESVDQFPEKVDQISKQWEVPIDDVVVNLIVSNVYVENVLSGKITIEDIEGIATRLGGEKANVGAGIYLERILSPFVELGMTEEVRGILQNIEPVPLQSQLLEKLSTLEDQE
jgi:hypothetical protein